MNSSSLSTKTAIVTGAGSGIGEATARKLAAAGATVLVTDIDSSAAERVAANIRESGGAAQGLCLDVSDKSKWDEIAQTALRNHGQLDILVNNAGISISKPITELTLEQWQQVMRVNLDGVFLGTQAAIASMAQGGSIVNVASVSGIKAFGGASAYCSSKAAIRMFSRSAAIECANADNGIRVNVVTPGGVKTPMWEREEFFLALIAEHGDREQAFAAMTGGVPSQAFFSSEEVAEAILYFASDESARLTGAETILDRGHTG